MLEEFECDLLRQHDVANRQIASGREAHREKPPAVLIEELNVHLVAVPDAIAPTRNSTQNLEVPPPLILLTLLLREVFL